jgi:hypothetical protein
MTPTQVQVVAGRWLSPRNQASQADPNCTRPNHDSGHSQGYGDADRHTNISDAHSLSQRVAIDDRRDCSK